MPSPAAPEKTTRCPRCGSDFIERRARHGLADYFRFLIGRFPFRCRHCGERFYLPQRGTQDQNL